MQIKKMQIRFGEINGAFQFMRTVDHSVPQGESRRKVVRGSLVTR